jgi:cytoskeletal protein RodZ
MVREPYFDVRCFPGVARVRGPGAAGNKNSVSWRAKSGFAEKREKLMSWYWLVALAVWVTAIGTLTWQGVREYRKERRMTAVEWERELEREWTEQTAQDKER